MISWSAPNLIVPPSARNKSDHSSAVEPNEEPSATAGVKAVPVITNSSAPAILK